MSADSCAFPGDSKPILVDVGQRLTLTRRQLEHDKISGDDLRAMLVSTVAVRPCSLNRHAGQALEFYPPRAQQSSTKSLDLPPRYIATLTSTLSPPSPIQPCHM